MVCPIQFHFLLLSDFLLTFDGCFFSLGGFNLTTYGKVLTPSTGEGICWERNRIENSDNKIEEVRLYLIHIQVRIL